MSGYIKLYRGWSGSEIFDRAGPYCPRAAWVWLLEKAAWKDCHRRDAHKNLVNVNRGQLHTSTRALGTAWGWSKNKVERFLRDLERCQMVDRQTDQHGILVTICNYEEYQGSLEGERTTERDSHGPVTDQSRTTQEEGKEGKERKTNITRLSASRPVDVNETVWQDFEALRKAKRAPITDTALKAIRQEAGKVGWSLQAALTECVARGWQGFKAEWIGEGEQPLGHQGVGI